MRYFLGLLTVMMLWSVAAFPQFSYQVDKNLRVALKKEVWQKLKNETPQENRLTMGLYFSGNSLFKSYQGAAQKYGYPPDNLVTAMAFLQVICQEVKQGTTMSTSEIKAVYEAQKQSILKNNSFEGLASKEIQKLAEPIILSTMWLFHLNQMRAKDRFTLSNWADGLLKTYTVNTDQSKSSSSKQMPPTTVQDDDQSESNSSEPVIASVDNTEGQPEPEERALGEANISQIIMRTVTSYGLGGVFVANKIYVLFDNGAIFTEPVRPLEPRYLAQTKLNKPGKWSRWERRNGVLYYTSKKSGKEYDWKKWFDVRKVRSGHTFNGGFQTMDPFGGAVVTNASTIYFNNNGAFVWSTVKGGYNDWKSVYLKSKHKGKYHISGHKIVFTYTDGRSESYFFALYPKSDEHFVIGSSHFVPLEN